MRKRSALFLSLIVLIAVAAGIFVYPKWIGAKWRPWRLGLDLVGGSHLVYEMDLSAVAPEDQESVINGLRDVIERRVNLFGVTEPQVYVARSGETTNLVVDLAGIRNVSEAISQIGETPYLEFHEVIPAESLGIETEGEGEVGDVFIPTGLTGRYLESSELSFNPTTNMPEILFSLNDEGAQLFAEITRRNAGKPLCVFVDGQPIMEDIVDSCPMVQGEITGGNAQITGNFTVERARTLVERFNAGALPAPITLVNQDTISGTLGADSLRAAVKAGIIGAILVVVFMLVYYRTLGIFASLSLLIYAALTLGIFKLVPVTLTLAGLAGFVLTIGMAVDANILIFERIKEEMKKGLSRETAVREGFRHAWSSIRDANTSTIITALILYFFTTGFIKGFALTLLIGVLVSLFSAVTTTRLFLQTFLREKRVDKNKKAAQFYSQVHD